MNWRFSAWLNYLLGTVMFLVAWELSGRHGWLGPSFPPLSDVAGAFESERIRRLLMRSLGATVTASAIAFVIGALSALLLALVAATQPWSEKGFDTFASSLYAVPTISFGPVLILLAGPANTAIVLGALSTYFPIYVALTSALRMTPSGYSDIANVLGASRSRQFFRLKLPYAIPAFVDGLRLGAPAAVLGVILGEWFGASRGLGVLIISSMQNVLIPQLWAAAVLAIASTYGAYILLTGVYRIAFNRFSW